MEDAATAEISRSQVWQWVRHGRFDRDRVREEVDAIREGMEPAAELFERVALDDDLRRVPDPARVRAARLRQATVCY